MTEHHAPAEAADLRLERLRSTIERARIARGGVDGERLLFAVGAVLVPVGLLLIGVAWRGVANTGAVFEQVPFLVSGGLGGLALVVVGAGLYFAWWQTRAMREAREHAARQVEVAEALLAEVRELASAQRRLADELAAGTSRAQGTSRARRTSRS